MRYGARSMFSMPPAIALLVKPSITSCAALAIAWAPEPQTRFTVRAGTSTGTPPLMAAWRAEFILLPAWITLPITTVSMSPPVSFARSSVARIATAPRSAAGISFSVPPYVPIAVRTGEQITTSVMDMTQTSSSGTLSQRHFGNFAGQCEFGFCGSDYLLNSYAGPGFQECCAAVRKCNHRHLAYQQVDRPHGRERQRAFIHDFRLPLGRVLHRNDYTFCPRYQVHCSAHPWHHFAGDHPIREHSSCIDLERSEHSHVHVAAADEAERHRAVKCTRPGNRGDWSSARIC